ISLSSERTCSCCWRSANRDTGGRDLDLSDPDRYRQRCPDGDSFGHSNLPMAVPFARSASHRPGLLRRILFQVPVLMLLMFVIGTLAGPRLLPLSVAGRL